MEPVQQLQALLALLQQNPAALQGFFGGLIAAILVNFVTWRWEIRKRKHNGNGKPPTPTPTPTPT